MVVDSASTIAKNFGMTDTLIGLTIVAFGTSLPELVTSIVAARKDEVDMALGNVIGSNIFNILLVLGVAAAISPITFSMQNIIDIIVLVIMSILVLIFAATKKTINRTEGIIMLVLYAGYVVYICNR
jgi:cation:H+ antiporter